MTGRTDKQSGRKIKAWLVLHGIKQARIAADMGLSRTTIGHWINGGVQSQRIYNYFIELGCPREFFVGRPEHRRAA